jgi:hypothetical protein
VNVHVVLQEYRDANRKERGKYSGENPSAALGVIAIKPQRDQWKENRKAPEERIVPKLAYYFFP